MKLNFKISLDYTSVLKDRVYRFKKVEKKIRQGKLAVAKEREMQFADIEDNCVTLPLKKAKEAGASVEDLIKIKKDGCIQRDIDLEKAVQAKRKAIKLKDSITLRNRLSDEIEILKKQANKYNAEEMTFGN